MQYKVKDTVGTVSYKNNPIWHANACNAVVTEAKHKPEFNPQKTSEVWGIYCEDLG